MDGQLGVAPSATAERIVDEVNSSNELPGGGRPRLLFKTKREGGGGWLRPTQSGFGVPHPGGGCPDPKIVAHFFPNDILTLFTGPRPDRKGPVGTP